MLSERELLAMTPAEWAAHVEAHQKKEARRLAWECRLHGMKHRSGRAITDEDFLPKTNAAKAPPLSEAELLARWQAPLREER